MPTQNKLNILLVDDEDVVHNTLGPYLTDSGHRVEGVREGNSALRAIESNDFDLALIDIRMPGMDGITLLEKLSALRPNLASVMITGHGNLDLAIQALRLGAADFLTKPIKLKELDAVLEKALRLSALRRDKSRLQKAIIGIQAAEDSRMRERRMVGESTHMADVRGQIAMAVEAKCDTILITGETGVGKEVVARELHFISGADESPFIAVACPALPETLIESELFGHVKGSFTGATEDKPGFFEMADGGTLFLDEVADLSAGAQAKLLRALETRSIRRIGSVRESKVNVRIVAATNVNLAENVKSGKFRQDLFYRLNVFAIHIVPLRERKEDILPLALHFLNSYAQRSNIQVEGFSERARDALLNYSYPGNARELRNLVERATILARKGEIEPVHLNLQECSPREGMNGISEDGDPEHREIVNALEKTKWNRRAAAQELGISYSSLRYKMKKLGLE